MGKSGKVEGKVPLLMVFEVLDTKRMRVFSFNDHDWFCVEGPYRGTEDWEKECTNATARGTFLDKETAERDLPVAYKTWPENRMYIQWLGTKAAGQ